MNERVRSIVWERAGGRCEYCQMQAGFDELTFQIEHVIPKKHEGSDDLENLALACFTCNNRKGTNLSGLDPETGKLTRVFNPGRDKWADHFEWQGPVLVGRTAIGRTTVRVLAMNLDYRCVLRAALIQEGVFP